MHTFKRGDRVVIHAGILDQVATVTGVPRHGTTVFVLYDGDHLTNPRSSLREFPLAYVRHVAACPQCDAHCSLVLMPHNDATVYPGLACDRCEWATCAEETPR